MAKKRDLLDEIIDIRSDWNALSRTGDDLVNQLTSEEGEADYFDPDDYSERPRVNSTYCASAVTKDDRACRRCMDVCPVDAISITGAIVRASETCLRCGLCSTVCPTEAFQVRTYAPMALYDKIARVATAYEQCYITCTRALDRKPLENEILLPCVGAIPREVWFDLLCDYDNLSVYLPLGVCDECVVSHGEEIFGDEIASAEEWSGESVGLEVDEHDLGREQKRAYKRSQFVSGMTQAGTRLVSRSVPMLAGAQAVSKRLQEHSKQISDLQKTLEAAVGSQSTKTKRRILTRRRRLLMAGLQKYPDLAEELILPFPEVDVDKCTLCGDCTKACTVHALDMDQSGRVIVEQSYCVNCGACAALCPEDAIRMVDHDSAELVVVDEQAEERERQKRRAKRMREEGKNALERGLDLVEGLAEDDED